MTTCYKVVRIVNGRRYSCYATEKYRLEYREGTVVSAPEGTDGIFVFQTHKDAHTWLQLQPINQALVIEVRPIGQHHLPKQIPLPNFLDFWYSGKYQQFLHVQPPPAGTVTYQKVKVLE